MGWLELQFSLSFWCRLSWICVLKGQGLLTGFLGCGSLPWAQSKDQGLGWTSENKGFVAFLLETKKQSLAKPAQLLPSPESPFQTCVNSTGRPRCDPLCVPLQSLPALPAGQALLLRAGICASGSGMDFCKVGWEGLKQSPSEVWAQ